MGFEPIKFLLERVTDLLKHEAKILLVDEKNEIQGLQRELEEIEGYLQDMDEVQRLAELNNVLRIKVQHLRQIVPQIEDLLDKVADRNLRQIKPVFFKKLKALFSKASNPIIHKHHLVGELKRIREQLNEIRKPEGYPLPTHNSQVTFRTKRQSDPNILNREIIIGLEEDVADLVAKFIQKVGERRADSAIAGIGGSGKTTLASQAYNHVAKEGERGAEREANLEDGHGANLAVVGMGGSGKTTLARRFYHHEEIKKAFPKRAWVCVSQQWNTHELLLQICAKLGVRLSDDERPFPHDKLTEFLRSKGPCLVVLDDVWEREALQDFLPTLLTGNGRVLITTRNKGILQFPGVDPFHIHPMRLLTQEQSRELFSKIVCIKFNEGDEEEEGAFAKLGRVMLGKCGGLPIAIVTLAGLLRTKDTIQQWVDIKDNVISIIMKDKRGLLRSEAIKKVLEFSYVDLPYHLKPCFLYLGAFKEDEKINADKLTNLWIDEGFVKPNQCSERRRLEEVAKSFLEELVQRCMVQVVQRDYAGDVEYIQIHDLIRDLCIDKAKELGFFRVISPSTTSSTQIEPCCRVVVQNDRNNSAELVVLDNSRLRTLICLNQYGSLGKQISGGFEKWKQVRVLHLERVELGDSVEHIGNMVLLRYLRLWGCRFRTLDFPKRLRNLRTFIFHTLGEGSMELCDNMFGSMEQLRILDLYILKSRDIPSISNSIGVDKLRNLQKLDIHAGEWIVKELPAAVCSDLQQLSITEIQSQPELDGILSYVNSNTLTCLQTLGLSLYPGSVLEIDLQEMNLQRHCQHLKALILFGKIKKQRDGSRCSFPPNLLSLFLCASHVEEEDDMNLLIAELSHLWKLSLSTNSYRGANITMNGLPNLHTLHLRGLRSLREWRITQGSLPQLRELSIEDCRELERIPDGIRSIKTLQLLCVRWMPRRFCKRLKKREEGESEEGEDFHLLQHIPTVDIQLID